MSNPLGLTRGSGGLSSFDSRTQDVIAALLEATNNDRFRALSVHLIGSLGENGHTCLEPDGSIVVHYQNPQGTLRYRKKPNYLEGDNPFICEENKGVLGVDVGSPLNVGLILPETATGDSIRNKLRRSLESLLDS